jgi:hypothetical protein
MQKIVINTNYGGYGLSRAAMEWLRERGCKEALEYPIYAGEYFDDGSEYDGSYDDCFYVLANQRDHPLLVACVKALGGAASGRFAKLKVVKIPDGVKWEISEYDGLEEVHEVHRSWS